MASGRGLTHLWGTSAATATAILLARWLGSLAASGTLGLEVYGALVALGFLVAGLVLARTEPAAPPDPAALETLTNRELTILHLVAEGKSNKEIAVALCIEVSTVKSHTNRLYAKIRCSNRREARRYWSRLPQKA